MASRHDKLVWLALITGMIPLASGARLLAADPVSTTPPPLPQTVAIVDLSMMPKAVRDALAFVTLDLAGAQFSWSGAPIVVRGPINLEVHIPAPINVSPESHPALTSVSPIDTSAVSRAMGKSLCQQLLEGNASVESLEDAIRSHDLALSDLDAMFDSYRTYENDPRLREQAERVAFALMDVFGVTSAEVASLAVPHRMFFIPAFADRHKLDEAKRVVEGIEADGEKLAGLAWYRLGYELSSYQDPDGALSAYQRYMEIEDTDWARAQGLLECMRIKLGWGDEAGYQEFSDRFWQEITDPRWRRVAICDKADAPLSRAEFEQAEEILAPLLNGDYGMDGRFHALYRLATGYSHIAQHKPKYWGTGRRPHYMQKAIELWEKLRELCKVFPSPTPGVDYAVVASNYLYCLRNDVK